MEIPDEIRDHLESRANVVGTGRGRRRVGGQATDEECLVVLVSRKLPEAELDEADRIPREVDVDGDRVRTDVQEVGDLRAQATPVRPAQEADRTRRWRPAPAGVSFGHSEISAGTLGSPPLETEDGRTVVLTNAHVAAPIGEARQGDPVLQPGPADGGTADDALGTLAEAAEISRDEPNTSDSALVEVDPSDLEGTILGVGEFAGFTDSAPDATYTKSGRTTGATTGDLRVRDVRVRVGGYYDEPTVFAGVDVFGPMSAGGDSGSLIGVADGGFRATHLLFAGSDRATVAAPMSAVEDVHGDLTPADATGGSDGGGSDDGTGGDPGDGAGDGTGDGSVAAVAGRRLRDAYGDGAVSSGTNVDFRVTGPVSMVAVAAGGEGELAAAAGRALAAADSGTVPVLAHPRSVTDAVVERLGHRLALLPVEST